MPENDLGFARFPWEFDESSKMHGVVCDYESLPGGSIQNYNEGKTGVHEIGHCLGLWHTFQNGCSQPGDEVDDTPFEASPASGCPQNRDSCPSAGMDPVHNFMDYSNDPCMYEFSNGQSDRIDEMISQYWPSLFNHLVTVDQKLADGQTSVDSIGHWENSSLFVNYAAPKDFSFSDSTYETLRGSQDIISGQKFNNWSLDDSVLNHRTFYIQESFPTELISRLTSTHNATIAADVPIANPTVEFKDPWLIDYPDPAYGNSLRNRGLDAPFISVVSGTNNVGLSTDYKGVFLNQYPAQTPNYYFLRGHLLIEGDPGSYYVFRRWIGTSVDFGSGALTNDRETPVVFTAANATATAQYHTLSVTGTASVFSEGGSVYIQAPLSTSINNHRFTQTIPTPSAHVTLTEVSAPSGYSRYRVSMDGDGTITYSTSPISSGTTVVITSSFQNISAGTWVGLPSGASVQIQDYSKFQGTAAQPIVLRGINSATWNGLSLSDMNNGESLEHVVVKQTQAALHPLDNVTRIRIANVTVDSAQFGFASNSQLTGLIALDQMEFLNIDSAAVFSASDEYYLADTLRITNSSFSPATAGRGNAIQVIPAYTNPYGNFKRIQIESNQIDGFDTGIRMLFHAGISTNPELVWSSDFARVVLANNRIENCTDYGVMIEGEHALFAHHNIIANCVTGYYMEWNTGHTGHGQDGRSHRILNETIVGNRLGVFFEQLTGAWAKSGYIGACLLYDNDTNLDLNGDLYAQGNLTSDPLFVNYGNGDYHLTSSSPAIDAGWEDFDGDNDTWETDVDDQDPDGTRMDAGALYYDPAPQAPYLTLDVSGNHPVLTWELTATSSGYPDRDIDRFRIYKHYYISKFNQQTSYATVNDGEATSYTDYGFGLNGGTSTATYKVQAFDNLDQSSAWSNSRNTTGMVAMKPASLPEVYQLGNAYPNPFNPSTTLEYGLPVTGNVDFRIYDMAGRLVYQEITVNQSAGWYELIWGGENQMGQPVPSGVYLISLTAHGTESREGYDGAMSFSQVQKVILMK
ncbi:MAG: T9SS type A sorting domain-containing protein [Candidatus Marinimicrobia bacterium]|nr:T9SS type A sorting domain-containing protein [Candidatus Neomarinimicrobiota bacterium]